ncbi:MAG: Ig-like domain-containing protein [Clostridiales Family XIII bacterium]|nr:Ig-like domain-containing protein [Clostridiales Family XIII bacterium]
MRTAIALLCAAAVMLSAAGASIASGASFAYGAERYELAAAPKSTPPKDSVTVIGDSVTLGAKLFAGMGSRISRTRGISWCRVDAKGSRQLAAGVKLVKELKKNKKLGKIVVYSLTTNGSFGYKEAKAAFKAAGKDRYVIFVTGYVKGHSYPNKSNAAVRKLASKQKRVFVADWNKLIRSKKNKQLSDDYCHLTPTSGRWFVSIVRNAVKDARAAHVARHRAKLKSASRLAAVELANICVGEYVRIPAGYWGAYSGGGMLRWESSDPSVLSVLDGGIMKGEALGPATVTVTDNASPARKTRLAVNVVGVATEVETLELRASKKGGYSLKLTAVPVPRNATGIPSFTSSNPKVAKVNRAGIVIGKKKGRATITVRLGNAAKSVSVRVK